jgi:transposase-like protein
LEKNKLWKKRSLEEDYLYVWADGIYPKAGPKNDTMAVFVLVGLNRQGEKEILSLVEGYRESADLQLNIQWHVCSVGGTIKK